MTPPGVLEVYTDGGDLVGFDWERMSRKTAWHVLLSVLQALSKGSERGTIAVVSQSYVAQSTWSSEPPPCKQELLLLTESNQPYERENSVAAKARATALYHSART